MNVPRKIGRWDITKVFVNLEYPDTTTVRKECVLNGSVWVGTVDGCASSGTSTNGFIVTASGIDEDGNTVSNYVLGAGDLYVQKLDGSITPDQNAAKMFFYEETPTTPKEGDTTFIQGALNIWDGTAWTPVAQVPTKTSDLTNDSGFVISSEMETSLELKQDKFSEDQLSAIDQSLYELQTKISFADENPTIYFVSPAYSLSKTILKEKGILAEDGTTWLKEPFQIETGSNVSEIQAGLFQNATSLIRFTGKNITMIWGQAFSGCTALTKVEIPSTINLMGANTFSGCSSLTNLTLPKTLATVARMAFNNTSLQQVMFDGKTLAQVKAMANYSKWGLTEDKIYTNAFENQLPTKTSELSNDSGFVISSEMETSLELKQDKFSEDQLSAIDFAVNIDSTVVEYLLGEVSSYMIVGGMTPTDIPNIENAINIKIGKSVTSINQEVFLGCDNLTSITIPNSVTSIGDSSFSGCAGLSSIVIPDSVVSIGYSAFQECTNLNSIVIGENVTTIGGGAFYECANLTNVIFRGKTLSEV